MAVTQSPGRAAGLKASAPAAHNRLSTSANAGRRWRTLPSGAISISRTKAASRRHSSFTGPQAIARLCVAHGLEVAPPQAAFYLYPDFAPWRDRLRTRFGIGTGTELATLLLQRYGLGALAGSAFGE